MVAVFTFSVSIFWSILAVIIFRYLILATLAFVIYYAIKKRSWLTRKIQQRFPANSDYFREVAYSIIAAIIFAIVGFGVFTKPVVDYTQVYYKISDYGVVYFIVSIFLMILVHDTYFYWTHRWMHHKSVYRFVHRVHHLSTNPSPWAAMAFHPIEAVIEALVMVLIGFLFPVHPLAIAIFLFFMMTYNVYGHLGYEIYPKGFSKNKIGRWINTSVNHNQHHQYFTGNFGLYFLWWDRWMGTIREDYDSRFEQVADGKQDRSF